MQGSQVFLPVCCRSVIRARTQQVGGGMVSGPPLLPDLVVCNLCLHSVGG